MLKKCCTALLAALAVAYCAWSPKTVVPVLMFHRVHDTPKFPEQSSTAQLTALFNSLWKYGWAPVSVSDLASGRLDSVVPKGKKPVVITIDDGHPSVIYSAAQFPELELGNQKSFLTVLCETAKAYGLTPRGTAFICEDDAGGYFGAREPLSAALARIHAAAPHFEVGYHTREHRFMKYMTPAQVRDALVSQREQFRALGVLGQIAPVLAYPYGFAPDFGPQALLSELGFTAAVLAFPGRDEYRDDRISFCGYDGVLECDRFLIPRPNIGAVGYAPRTKRFFPIDPTSDFVKDTAGVAFYVSRGAK
ncbi:MAG: polysaccharide deacetylase family protein [Pyramidobacter sp.]|nr:polysaccharide deacetylase family protein [Pyramidobacter sp.]